MSIKSSFFSADPEDNLFASSHEGERALNRAILTAEISRSCEEYLEIVDRFYAEDIEQRNQHWADSWQGKGEFASL